MKAQWCKRIDDNSFARGMYQEADPAADLEVQARICMALADHVRRTIASQKISEFGLVALSRAIRKGEVTLEQVEEPKE